MKSNVVWEKDLTFSASTETGFNTIMDGEGKALSPMEAVLNSVGACSSIDIVDILKKGRFTLTKCECVLEAKRAENPPRVFTDIHAHYKVQGEGLTEKAVQRAVTLSAEKYCSVMLMLQKSVNITTSFEILAGE
ncbi:OsmC family protein [Alteromonas aestuariivivens]|uniref:OsmC family protein n=1 Tax=Alteromonas aestuariivivens TaxID=1938339 RepID=A0A3D8MAT9_9ALTE|nr:OsmC family protein [Alteromonas aestuariivivens]RDV27400.1 OsmC family protein [Alteromonas aestuariivivens]